MENSNTTMKRDGEETDAVFRSGRFYCVETEWYFSVREQSDQGPYSSKLSAEQGLKTYLSDFEYFKTDNTRLFVVAQT